MLNHRILECSANGTNANKTALNWDCLDLIFSEMNFMDLLNMNEVSKEFSTLAADAFRRKFASKTISVVNTRDLLFGREPPYYVRKFLQDVQDPRKCTIESGRIQLQNVHLALKTLKYFGNVIEKLDLSLKNCDTRHSTVIFDYVNKYCAESLAELSLNIQKGNILDQLKKPFKKVERLIFNIQPDLKLEHRNAPPMNQTFPSLRALILEKTPVYYVNEYFNCYLPKLEHFSLRYGFKYINEELFKNVIQSNPQIRSIDFEHGNERFLEEINLMLPQLEHLAIHSAVTAHREIHFENVIKFKTNSFEGTLNIHFPKLQEFQLFFTPEKGAELFAFLENHTHLRRLHTQCWKMSGTEFEGIISRLPNLEEMFLENHYGLAQIDSIVKFLETDQKIMEFRLGFTENSQKQELQSKLQCEWNIRHHGHETHLTRKI